MAGRDFCRLLDDSEGVYIELLSDPWLILGAILDVLLSLALMTEEALLDPDIGSGLDVRTISRVDA